MKFNVAALLASAALVLLQTQAVFGEHHHRQCMSDSQTEVDLDLQRAIDFKGRQPFEGGAICETSTGLHQVKWLALGQRTTMDIRLVNEGRDADTNETIWKVVAHAPEGKVVKFIRMDCDRSESNPDLAILESCQVTVQLADAKAGIKREFTEGTQILFSQLPTTVQIASVMGMISFIWLILFCCCGCGVRLGVIKAPRSN